MVFFWPQTCIVYRSKHVFFSVSINLAKLRHNAWALQRKRPLNETEYSSELKKKHSFQCFCWYWYKMMRRGNKLLLYLFFLSPKILCILSLRQMQTASYYVVSYSLRSFCKASRYFESTEIQYVFLIRNGSSPFPSWLRSSFITAVSEELSSLKFLTLQSF